MRKRKRRELIAKLEEAARPLVCPRCGKAEFYHWCDRWEREVHVSTNNSNRQESDRNPTSHDS